MSERTTLQIAIAVKEADPNITDEELRLCIEAQSHIEHFIRQDLIKLIETIREETPLPLLKMRAEFAWGTVERMFDAAKKPPKQWLGPNGIPGTDGHKSRLEWAKRVYEKATGEKL